MKKQIIRLTEGDLHRIITETVKNYIMENTFADKLRDELTLPQEARLSQMTDEEIYQLLNQIKQKEDDYLAGETYAKERRGKTVPSALVNRNIDNTQDYKEYINGNLNVPYQN